MRRAPVWRVRLAGACLALAVGAEYIVAGPALVVALVLIGMAPPNEASFGIVGGTVVVLGALWFGLERRRFPGFHVRPRRPGRTGPSRPNGGYARRASP